MKSLNMNSFALSCSCRLGRFVRVCVRVVLSVYLGITAWNVGVASEKAAPSSVTIKRFKNVPVEMATGELVQREGTDIAIKSRGLNLDVTRNYRSQRESIGMFGYGWSWSNTDHLEFPGEFVVEYVTAEGATPIFPDVSFTGAYARACIASPSWVDGGKAVGAPNAIGGYGNVAHFYGNIAGLQPLVAGGWGFLTPTGASTIVQVDLTSIGATAFDDDHPQYAVKMKLSAGGTNSTSWGHRAYDFDYVTITSDRASWTWNDVNNVQARLALDSYKQNIPMDVFVDTFHLGVTYVQNTSGEVKYLPGTNFEFKHVGDQYFIQFKDGSKNIFGSDGSLLRKEDSLGNVLLFSYDAMGRMLRVEDALKQSLTFIYEDGSQAAKVTKVVDHLGRSVTYRYNGNDLVEFTDLMGATTKYEYSSSKTDASLQHNLIRRTDPAGYSIRVDYYTNSLVLDRVQGYFDGETTPWNTNEVRYAYVKGTTYSWMPGLGSIQGVVYNISNDISQVYLREGEMNYKESDGVNLLNDHSASWVYSANTAQWQNIDCALGDSNGLSAFNPAMGTNAALDVSGWGFNVPGISNDIVNVTVGVLGNSTNLIRFSASGWAFTNWTSSSNKWIMLDITSDKAKWEWRDISNLTARISLPSGVTKSATVSIDAFTVKVKYRHFDPGQDPHDNLYFYDLAHNMVSVVNDGTAHQFAYDGRNNLISWTDPEGAVWRYEYEPTLNRRTKSIDPLGNVTTMEYDNFGRLIKIIAADGGVTTLDYDQFGNNAHKSDPLGKVVSYTYDANGLNLITERDSQGTETHFDYDPFGNCIRIRHPNGSTRHFKYDRAGSKIWEKDEGGTESKVEYDGRGLATNVISALGTRDAVAIQNFYDGRGLLIGKIDSLGHSSATEYDCLGNPDQRYDRVDALTEIFYDAYDRPWIIADANEFITESLYDARNNVVTNIDRRGGTTVCQYDKNNRPVLAIDKGGNSIATTYDDNGNKITDTFSVRGYPGCTENEIPVPLTIAYMYDSMGRLTNKVAGVGREDARSTVTSYDLNGRVVRQQDALGNYRTSSYDANGNTANECMYTAGGQLLSTITSAFDINDRLIMRLSGLGSLIVTNQFEYDMAGRKMADIDSRGGRTTYSYDHLGRNIAVTDSKGKSRKIEYDRNNNKIRETDRLGLITEYCWDAEGRLIQKETGVGLSDSRTFGFLYDNLGRMVKEIDPLGFASGVAYDEEGNTVAETNKLGYVRLYTYDLLGRLTNTVDEAGGQIQQLLDGRGKVCKLIDKQGYVTCSAYDGYGRQIKVTDALGGKVSFAYDVNDNKIQDVDPRGRVSRYEYDAASRMTNKVVGVGLPSAMAISTTYDALGRVLRVADSDGTATTFEYDEAGNPISKTDARGCVSRTLYDELGRQVEVIDPSGASTRSEYDAEGNVTAVIDALGNRKETVYDLFGQTASVVDCMNNVGHFAYDRLGRLTSAMDALGNSKSQGWDAVGNLKWSRSPDGATTSYAYDRLGHRTNTVDALGFRNSKTIDPGGNVLQATDSRGNSMSYTYDGAGRVLSITDPTSNTLSYAYDVAGNKIREVSPSGLVTTYGYDLLGRLISKTLGAGSNQARTFRYEYDSHGRLAREYDPMGNAIVFQYDQNGNKIRITDRRGNSTSVEYDAMNRVTNTVDALGAVARVQYDPMGRIIQTVDRRGNAKVNSYDDLGQLVAIQDAEGGVKSNAYDALGRLVQEIAPNGTKTMLSYDGAGHLTGKVVGYGLADSRTFSYNYDLLGRLICETDPLGGTVARSFDANGNETTQAVYNAAGTLLRIKTVDYDVLNQPVVMTDAMGKVWRSEYDNAGRKVADIDPLGNRVATEYNIFGEKTAMIDQMGNRTVNVYDRRGQVIETINALGQRARYRYDSNGNRTAVIDDNGHSVLTSYDALNRVATINRSMPTVPYDDLRRGDVNGDGAIDTNDVNAIGGVP